MTHTYTVTGMTCEGCVAKVSHLLKQVPDVNSVTVQLDKSQATVGMDKHVPTHALQNALEEYPKYTLSDVHTPVQTTTNIFDNTVQDDKTWFETYKPIVLIFSYISIIAAITALSGTSFSGMVFMRTFMAGFFLTFSFFKMLDLKGFANSYAMYDVIAKKIPAWGYIYAFLELALGFAFSVNFEPVYTNAFTAVLMSVSLIGVLQSVLNKKQIQCACLGAVFNLPMSTVTIIEDSLMIGMSIAMLFMYL